MSADIAIFESLPGQIGRALPSLLVAQSKQAHHEHIGGGSFMTNHTVNSGRHRMRWVKARYNFDLEVYAQLLVLLYANSTRSTDALVKGLYFRLLGLYKNRTGIRNPAPCEEQRILEHARLLQRILRKSPNPLADTKKQLQTFLEENPHTMPDSNASSASSACDP